FILSYKHQQRSVPIFVYRRSQEVVQLFQGNFTVEFFHNFPLVGHCYADEHVTFCVLPFSGFKKPGVKCGLFWQRKILKGRFYCINNHLIPAYFSSSSKYSNRKSL